MSGIKLAKGLKTEGFPKMLAVLLRQNLEQKPEKLKDFNLLNIVVGLKVEDFQMEITMVFDKGQLTIHQGLVKNPKLIIMTNSEILLNLILIHIKFGLPWYFDAHGRKILKGLISGRLKIKGMIAHLIALNRLTRVISVS